MMLDLCKTLASLLGLNAIYCDKMFTDFLSQKSEHSLIPLDTVECKRRVDFYLKLTVTLHRPYTTCLFLTWILIPSHEFLELDIKETKDNLMYIQRDPINCDDVTCF